MVVKSYSDRGKISELNKNHENDEPLQSWEVRLKKLVDFAMEKRDNILLTSLGFFYIDHNQGYTNPTVYLRLKEKVNSVIDSMPANMKKSINRINENMKKYIEAKAATQNIKIAQRNAKDNSFRRVS
jgi:hypothetical protein